jgi:ComF family protein
MKKIIDSFLDLFFPAACVGCGLEKTWLCEKCAKTIPVKLKQQNIGKLPILSLFAFSDQGVLRELLHHLKYNGIWELASVLGDLAVNSYEKAELIRLLNILVGNNSTNKLRAQDFLLITVPSSVATLRQRGYNQVELLAEVLAERLEIAYWSGGLGRKRHTTQVGQDVKSRSKQARENYYWKKDAVPMEYQDKYWILLDDIYTTGSTLLSCAEQLRPHTNKTLAALVFGHRI